jgi:hypothetical protein
MGVSYESQRDSASEPKVAAGAATLGQGRPTILNRNAVVARVTRRGKTEVPQPRCG